MRRLVLLLFLVGNLHAEVPPLLAEMTERWADERSRWTFTQVVREYDGPKVATIRVEHYDVTRGENHRWKLISLDGRAPTTEEEAAWSKRKNRPRLFAARPLGDYLDLASARVVREDERSIGFEVPLSRVMALLLSGEKISLVLTIDKQTHLLEHGRVELGGPFTIALGLAKVIDLDVELELPPGEAGSPDDTVQARGSGYAVVNKFGRRIEYTWTDFARVPAPAAAAP